MQYFEIMGSKSRYFFYYNLNLLGDNQCYIVSIINYLVEDPEFENPDILKQDRL